MDSETSTVGFDAAANTASFQDKFGWPEYVVFVLVLGMSACIGIYYGCFGSKQKSNEEYIMGNRRMSALPVALSLLCSFISAIALLGLPSELYMYGTQTVLSMVIFIPFTLSLYYLYIPVYFNLQLTSAYEYFELRFNRTLRLIISIVSICYLLFYMSMVVYGPSLALNQVTGLNRRMLSAATFLVCIFYSTLGGFKTVLWTDALQGVIMIASLSAIVGKGVADIGGPTVVWEKLTHGGRLEFFNFDPDPRTRYTVWTSVIAGYITWLQIYAATQANIQRFVSMPDMKTVRNSLIINFIGLHIIVGLSYASGMAIYARYHGCDPVSLKAVSSSDQLLPYFVMDVLGDLPGLPGVFVAGLTCASLSTVSSGLNALAAIITEDYVKKWRPDINDEQLSKISKLISVTSGLISFGFLFVTELLGNILPASSSLMGLMMAPALGLFTLGMFFPWANSRGTILGLATSFAFLMFIGVGRLVAGSQGLLPNQLLPVSTAGCAMHSSNFTLIHEIPTIPVWKQREDNFLIQLLSVSFNWLSVIGVFLTITLGLLFSIMFRVIGKTGDEKVSSKCLSPPLLALWTKLFPGQMAELIKLDNYEQCATTVTTSIKYQK